MFDDTEKMQLYLRENILNKGYDAEEFMNFLKSKKGDNALDLRNWDKYELEKAVTQFIALKKLNSKINLPQRPNLNNDKSDNTNQKKDEINNEEKKESEKNVEDNKHKLLNEKYKEYINAQMKLAVEPEWHRTKPSDTTELTDAFGVEIKLSSPEKIEGGIFAKSYVTYLVETNPFGFRVRKRYSDFEWLKHILSLHYPASILPPLCKKKMGDRFTERLVNKRQRLLQKFMEGILVHPLIRNSTIFYDFISCDNEEEAEKKKKKYEKMKIPENIKDMRTVEGQVRISVNKEKEIYLDNIKDNADIYIQTLEQITKAYKSLIVFTAQASEKMNEISQLWKKLYDSSIAYYDTNNTCESFNLMHKIMKGLAEVENKKMTLMNNYVREYFRFVKNEFHSMKDLATKVYKQKEAYHSDNTNLINLKEKLFNLHDITYYELNDKNDYNYKALLLQNKKLAFIKMLPNDTKRVLEVKQKYGFYLNSLISEYERLRMLNSRRNKDQVKIFAKMLIDILTQFHNGVNELIYYFEGLKDDEDIKPESIGYSSIKFHN